MITGVITNLLPRPLLPDESARAYPDGLGELMRRCWQHEAAQRPTFDPILDELERLEQEEGVDAMDAPVPQAGIHSF